MPLLTGGRQAILNVTIVRQAIVWLHIQPNETKNVCLFWPAGLQQVLWFKQVLRLLNLLSLLSGLFPQVVLELYDFRSLHFGTPQEQVPMSVKWFLDWCQSSKIFVEPLQSFQAGDRIVGQKRCSAVSSFVQRWFWKIDVSLWFLRRLYHYLFGNLYLSK